MITVTILGDSWGEARSLHNACLTSNWSDNKWTIHTEFLLSDLGYRVDNFSRGSTGNMYSLYMLDTAIQEGYKTDYVIWFHTEAIRDVDFDSYKGQFKIDKVNEEKYREIYKYAESIKIRSNAYWIVIGGEAPLHSIHTNFIIGDSIKEDWRSEIVGRQLPKIYTLSKNLFFDHPKNGDDIDTRLKLIEDHDITFKGMSESNFPDGCHPGEHAHRDLTIWIDNIIKENEHAKNQ